MPLILILIRKLNSAQNRLRRWVAITQQDLVSWVVSLLTEKYWLIDYLPVKRPQRAQVLLVRLDLIGDFIIWLDSARAYRQLYPTQKIVLYANAIWAGLAEQFDYWDEVIPVDVPKLRTNDWFRLRQLVGLRLKGFSVAIQPTYSRECAADLTVRATGAVTRIGHLGNLSNISQEKKQFSDRWYTKLVDLNNQPIVELNLNAAFIRALGRTSFKSSLPRIKHSCVLPLDFRITKPYFIVFPGASWAPKTWSTTNFAEVAKMISEQRGLLLVLCGTAAECKICNEVEQLAQVPAINLAGRTSLNELIEVIRGAKLLIANDSAAIHIATATQTQSVCIFGGGHFGRFLPYAPEEDTEGLKPTVMFQKMDCYGCNWQCRFLTNDVQTVPCVSAIDPASLASVCLKLTAAW